VKTFPIFRGGGFGPDSDFDHPGGAQDLDNVLRSHGFERMPITGVYSPMYLGKDSALSLSVRPYHDPNEGYSFCFGAKDTKEFLRLLQVIEDNLHWKSIRTDHIVKG
jgi:hypothetical protein